MKNTEPATYDNKFQVQWVSRKIHNNNYNFDM